MVDVRVRRAFVAVWLVLGLAGALDHTIAEKYLGLHVDLMLPHLKYGYVMFNINPRTVHVYEYAGKDGARHPLSDLVIPAPGYPRARASIDSELRPAYPAEVCLRAFRARGEEYDFFVETYEVDVSSRKLTDTRVFHCSAQGLRDEAAAR